MEGFDGFKLDITNFYENNIVSYIENLQDHPLDLFMLILDLLIVGFLIVKLFKSIRHTRASQLAKGILILIVITGLTKLLHLYIFNAILTAIMNWGVLALMIIFQPELRRALEQLGTNKLTKFFGMEKDLETKAKEDVYKILIAVNELAKTKTGALIVIERDIKLQDIIDTGIIINSDVSPQLLANIFVPNTPLHDGAVIISENRIMAAACILPLASDNDISKALGTRHRAALGMAKETDSIVIIVSEESGKVSVAKDGKLIIDIDEDNLRQLLLDNINGKDTPIVNGVDKFKKKIVNKKVDQK